MVSDRQELLRQNVSEYLAFDFFKKTKIILQEKYSLITKNIL